jgi:hypothetical protein
MCRFYFVIHQQVFYDNVISLEHISTGVVSVVTTRYLLRARGLSRQQFDCIILDLPYYTKIILLSWRRVLKECYYLLSETIMLLETKNFVGNINMKYQGRLPFCLMLQSQ